MSSSMNRIWLMVWRRTQHWQNRLWLHSAKAVQLSRHRTTRPQHPPRFPSPDEAKLPRQQEQQHQHRRVYDLKASEQWFPLQNGDVIHAGTVIFSVIRSIIWHSLLPEPAKRKRASFRGSAADGRAENRQIGLCLCFRWWINLSNGLC